MPIEIRELVITASISESNSGTEANTGGKSIDREEIIADCVDQVMEIIRNQTER